MDQHQDGLVLGQIFLRLGKIKTQDPQEMLLSLEYFWLELVIIYIEKLLTIKGICRLYNFFESFILECL